MQVVREQSSDVMLKPKFLTPEAGLRLQSGPGRDLIFKVTGEDTAGKFDYFVVEVAPHGGPPLHVHHLQEETLQVLKGRFKVRCGDQTEIVEQAASSICPPACRTLSSTSPTSRLKCWWSMCPAAATSSTRNWARWRAPQTPTGPQSRRCSPATA